MLLFFFIYLLWASQSGKYLQTSKSGSEQRGLYMSAERRTRRSHRSSLRCQIDTPLRLLQFHTWPWIAVWHLLLLQRSTQCVRVRGEELRRLEKKKMLKGREKKKSIPMWKQTLTPPMHSSAWNALQEFRREVTANEAGVSDCSRGATISVSQRPTSSNTHLHT